MPKPIVKLKKGSVSKVQRPKPPNLPQHDLPEPYNRLLDLDLQEPDETFEKIASELKAGDANAAAQKLIALVLDDSFYSYADKYPDFTEYMKREKRMLAPANAVRVLTYMGESGQAAIEPLLPLLNTEDDFLREELPLYYGAMGEASIEALTRTLNDTESDEYLRSGASDCLTEMAEQHPTLRDQIVSIVEQALANEKTDDELNGFLVCNLIDLNAKESYPLIEQAYEDDRVDESIVGLGDVQEHFGIPVTALPPDWTDELDEADEGEAGFVLPLPALLPPDDDSEPAQQPFVAGPKLGRNEPCFCGSGKKYKKCHGV